MSLFAITLEFDQGFSAFMAEMDDGSYMVDAEDPVTYWTPVSLLHEEHLDASTAFQMLLDIADELRLLGLEVIRTKIWR